MGSCGWPILSLAHAVMDLQIALLRAILAGEQPGTPQNIEKAFNRDVVAARAIGDQQRAIDMTIEALETERERLAALVEQSRERNSRLEELIPKEENLTTDEVPQALDIEKLRSYVSTLSTKYLASLGLGESQTIEKVLWRLVEVGARGEQLIVPADMPIVKYLGEEGLIESEPAYGGQLRIRLI